MRQEPEPVKAVVVELLPSLAYRLEVEASGAEVIAHPAAGTKRSFVRLRLRDVVLVELAPEDPRRGRIVRVLEK